MKKLIVSVLFLSSFFMFGQEQKVEVKEIPEFWFAAMEFSGSYQKMPENIGMFMQEFMKQGLGMPGPVLGIYYNSPQDVAEADLKWAVGMQVGKDADVKAPLKKQRFKKQKVVRYLHIGPYEKMTQSYQKVMSFIEKNGYLMHPPTFDRYLNNPQMVPSEQLRTEIWVLIEEK